MHDYQQHSDQQLIAGLQQSDRRAFQAIYDRHWQRTYESALRVLRDEDTCMDVIQDVFVWLWENREEVAITSLPSYLRTAVKFKLLNVIRHNKLRDAAYALLPPVDEPVNDAEYGVELAELRQLIDQFILGLPPQARRIFQMSRQELLSNKEIAEKLGLSEKTVKNQLHISLKKLRKGLGRFHFWATFFF